MSTSYEQIDRPNEDAPPRAVLHDAGEVLHDVATLVELQTALFREDLSGGAKKIVRALLVAILAIALAATCVPMALATLALTISSSSHLSLAGSFAITTAFGLAAACGLAAICWRMARTLTPIFQRSTKELYKNLGWLKQVLAKNRKSTTVA